MLNLSIAMFRRILSLLFIGWFALAQQTPAAPRIDTPLPGQAVQGVVSVSGATAMEGFASAQVEFRYEADPTQTWFLIQDQIPAAEGAVLASWDTTTISDGIYRLRLKVTKTDGREATFEVAGLRVRNYSIIETSTPAVEVDGSPAPADTPTATAVVVNQTPTPQPPNPASVTEVDLRTSAIYGLAVVSGIFLLFAIYLGVRRLGRR